MAGRRRSSLIFRRRTPNLIEITGWIFACFLRIPKDSVAGKLGITYDSKQGNYGRNLRENTWSGRQ